MPNVPIIPSQFTLEDMLNINIAFILATSDQGVELRAVRNFSRSTLSYRIHCNGEDAVRGIDNLETAILAYVDTVNCKVSLEQLNTVHEHVFAHKNNDVLLRAMCDFREMKFVFHVVHDHGVLEVIETPEGTVAVYRKYVTIGA